MPTEDARKKLLAAYAVALVEERASWERLSDPQLSELEHFNSYALWKPAAARLKTLGVALRDNAPPPATRVVGDLNRPVPLDEPALAPVKASGHRGAHLLKASSLILVLALVA